MINELVMRYITSILVLGSIPPLVMLLLELMSQKDTGRKSDSVEVVLFMIYNIFLISGLLTLWINGQFIFNHAQAKDYTSLALIRNSLKHIGILLVSWKLYFITRGGESHD